MGLAVKILKNNEIELNTVSAEIEHGDDVTKLAADMMDAMIKAKGIGLAANQVGITKRIIVMNTQNYVGCIVNPVITMHVKQDKLSSEGCLSVPGKQVKVKRHPKVVVEGFDENWNPIKVNMKQLSACCVQHEIDHLNGITI